MERPALHDILCGVLGSRNCYFESPADIEMKYPCFVYNYTNDLDTFADNIHYQSSKRYTVTYITDDPDCNISEKMKQVPYCTSDRNFAVDGLNHFVFTLYYNGPRIKEENNNE